MAAESPPGGTSTANAVYGEAAVHLRDFAAKYPVPNLVKVAKGQYRNIGVSKSVCRELYLHSVRTCPKILAVGVKIKDNRKSVKKVIVTSDQKYALPITYQGWWELLSEDGKAIRPISSVAELARIFPAKALVREPIKALTTKEGNNDVSLDRNRMLHSGEQLTLVGDMAVVIGSGKSAVTRRMLRCFDTKGEAVYLSLDQKGLFSPIAGQGNISGVHSIHSLTARFRLPVLVRLVHGIIPLRLERNHFTGVFRLLGLYDDDTAFVMPLKRDAKMVPISTREPLKLVPALNFTSVQDSEDCQHYHQRCGRMIASYLNSIHVLVNPPDIATVHKVGSGPDFLSSKPKGSSRSEEDILFEEVDDIYAYVRDGGAPPPPRPRPPNQRARVDNRRISSPSVVQTKPISPVIREYEGFMSKVTSPAVEDKKRKPSAAKVADGTSPSSERRHSDENYWEEPIYDEIERYQRKIQEGHRKQQPITESMEVLRGRQDRQTGEDRSHQPGIQEQPLGAEGDNRSASNRLEAVALRAPTSANDGASVDNVRQMYKNKDDDSSSGSRHNSLDKSDEDLAAGRQQKDTTPPPLPPKLFDFEMETEDVASTQSKSLPRPANRTPEVDIPSRSLPKDMFKFTKKSKSPKNRPAAESPENDQVHEDLNRKDSDSKKKEAEAKKREAEAKKREAETRRKEAAEAKKREAEDKKREAEDKKREAEAKKREKRESEARRKDSTENNPISRSMDGGIFGLSSKHKGPALTDPSPGTHGGTKGRSADHKHAAYSASTTRLSSSPEGASAMMHGSFKPMATHTPIEIPTVDHTGSARRYSQPGATASSPPRMDPTSASRRHSTTPNHSRGTSVAVTLGVSPPSSNEARNSVAGASVKVRSHSIDNGPVGPGSAHNSYRPQTLPGTHTQRIALTSNSAHMGRRQPKYVAVARVGDDKSSSTQDKANGSVSNLNRHIQSVHL